MSVYYTPDGKKLVARAAEKADDTPANWVRRISLKAARELLGEDDDEK